MHLALFLYNQNHVRFKRGFVDIQKIKPVQNVFCKGSLVHSRGNIDCVSEDLSLVFLHELKKVEHDNEGR